MMSHTHELDKGLCPTTMQDDSANPSATNCVEELNDVDLDRVAGGQWNGEAAQAVAEQHEEVDALVNLAEETQAETLSLISTLNSTFAEADDTAQQSLGEV